MRSVFLSLPVLLSILACAGPPPTPLSGASVEAALAPPDWNQVRVQAALVEHPLLPPAGSVRFDERDGLSADEAAILAVVANPTLRAERDRRGIAGAELLRAGILPNPSISASFGVPVGAAAGDTVTGFDLGLDWDLAALLSHGERVEAARAHARAIDLDVAWQEWQVAQAAKLHLQRLALADRRLVAARQAAAVARRVVEAIRRAVKLGVRTGADLAAAEAASDAAHDRLLDERSSRTVERIDLNRALGLPADRTIPIDPSNRLRLRRLRLRPLPPVVALVAELPDRRLDLAALRAGYDSQDAKLRAAVRSRFPKIGVSLGAGRDPEGIETAGGGVRIELPLFDRNQGEIAVARASRKQLFDEYAARLAAARSDVARIVEQIGAVRRRLVVADRSVARLIRRHQAMQQASAHGAGDRFAAESAAADLAAARLARLDLQGRLGDLAVALEIASGRALFSEPAPSAVAGSMR